MIELFGKEFENKTEAAKATYQDGMICKKCNCKITYNTWYTKIMNLRLNNLDLCGRCIKSIATSNKNKIEKHFTYATTKIIRGSFIKVYNNKSMAYIYILKDIPKYKDNFICSCGKNTMQFNDWHRTPPNHMKETLNRKDHIRILDFTDWRCKSCSSKDNSIIMNEAYRNLSEKDKFKKKKILSKITTKQHNNFKTKYTMVEGLLKSIKDNKLLKKLKQCKTIENLNKLYSKAHSIISKRLFNNSDKQYIQKILTTILNKNTNLTKERIIEILKYKKEKSELISWLNLLKEWFWTNTNKYKETTLYIAKVSNNRSIYKIGITIDINRRQHMWGKDSGCYDYEAIKNYPNRYCAAYAEYKLRTLFCIPKTEFINKKDKNKVLKYISQLKYDNNTKQDLINLGWEF